VVLARLESKSGGYRQDLRSTQRQQAIQLREAQIVADREAKGGDTRFGGNDLASRCYDSALDVLPGRGRDVEEVDLAVRGGEIAGGIEERRGVEGPLGAGSPSRIDPPSTYTPSSRARSSRMSVVGPGIGSAFAWYTFSRP
jgi:hypothetical protein